MTITTNICGAETRGCITVSNEQFRGWLTANEIPPHPLHSLVDRLVFVEMGEGGSTICELFIKCDHSVIGMSRPIDGRDYVRDVGIKMSFLRARDELWREVSIIARMSDNPEYAKHLPRDF